ncbi:MAG TPA: hypothetical protein VFT95_21360, partial [Micromonosporaceae bacterium]|nr:hypothetical protein [Micromonosporaceae bacterium]
AMWRGAAVRSAFDLFGQMCGRPGVFAGGPNRALVQQFPDAVLEVFRYHRAAMVVAPDFAESVIRRFGVPLEEVGTFTFPAVSNPDGPLVLAGDLLVLTRPAGPGARELIRYLATPQAPEPWIRDTGGFLAANPETSASLYGPVLSGLDTELRRSMAAGRARFDLGDQLGPVGGRDGLQLVLVEFLRRLGAGGRRDEAVRAALDAMADIETKVG